MIWAYFKLSIYHLLNLFKKQSVTRSLISLAFLFILFILASFSYVLGRIFTRYIFTFGAFSSDLYRLLLSALVSSLFALSVFSFVMVYFKTLFDKKLYAFFLAGKSALSISLSVYILTIFAGSWPFILISLPFFIGSARVLSADFLSLFLLLFAHLFISVFVASIGAVISILLALFMKRRFYQYMPYFLIGSVLAVFFFFIKVVFPYRLFQIFQYQDLSLIASSLRDLPLLYPLFPTVLFVDSFLGNMSAFLLLAFQSATTLFVFCLLAKNYYHRTWQLVNEGKFVASTDLTINRKTGLKESVSYFSENKIFAFFEKEALFFQRNINAFVYLLFIFLLFFLFAFFLLGSGRLQEGYANLENAVNVSMIFAVCYFFLLLGVRFVFPTFSTEGPFLKSIITSENLRFVLSLSKWLFFLAFSTVFAVFMYFILLQRINILALDSVHLFIYVLVSSLCVIIISLFFGHAFQKDLPKDDVEEVSTSVYGILVTILSLFIGVVFTWLGTSGKFAQVSTISLALLPFVTFLLFRLSYRFFRKGDL